MNASQPLFTRKSIAKIIVPLALQGLLSVAVGMIDSMMVSVKSETAFAGVSLVSSLDVLLIAMFGALTAGGSVVLAQLYGKGENERTCAAAKQLLYVIRGYHRGIGSRQGSRDHKCASAAVINDILLLGLVNAARFFIEGTQIIHIIGRK